MTTKMLDEDVLVLDGQSHHGSDGMASLSIGDGVRDHLRLVIAKSSKPVSELGSGLVSSAHTIMSFFERFSCLFMRKASE